MKIQPHPWHEIGEVGLGPDGKLLIAEPGHGPGIYRFRLTSGESPSVYIGESEDMGRRFRQYRNPEPSQRTNIRISKWMHRQVDAGGTLYVAVVTGAFLRVGDSQEPLDLERRTSRLLVEEHLLDEAREAGAAAVENVN